MTAFTESVVEDAALAWLEDVGWPLRCGVEARIGTLTAGQEWFKPWRTISGEALAPATMPQLQVLIEGVFEKRRLLHLIRDSLVFEGADGSALVKKMAECHQFHAVQLGGPRDAAGRRAAPRRRSRRRGARTLRSGPQGPVAQKPRAGAIFRGAAGRGGTRYQSRAIETAQVIEELIALAKDMRRANERGEELGLSDDEIAFYDAWRPATAP